MSKLQMFLGQAGTALLAVAFVGVLVRGHYRRFYSFAVYLAAILAFMVLILVFPRRFYSSSAYQAQQIAIALLRFSMAIELAIRTFRAFPGALATLRMVAFLIVSITAGAALLAPVPQDQVSFVGELEARVLNGTVWLFGAIAALILWYRLPTNRFRKAVLLSYLPYLLIFALAANGLGSFGWDRGGPFQYTRQVAYLLLVLYWAWIAWSRDPPPPPPPPADSEEPPA
jgi:hypothetical protein